MKCKYCGAIITEYKGQWWTGDDFQCADGEHNHAPTEEIDIDTLDDFTRGYIECLLWSSTDNADESGGEPLDANYDIDDITPESLERIVADCKDFQESNAALLEAAYADPEWDAENQRFTKPNYDASHAGYDFWLTRNGHGAGFWDRGLEQGDELTKAAKIYGGIDPLVEDGKVHVE